MCFQGYRLRSVESLDDELDHHNENDDHDNHDGHDDYDDHNYIDDGETYGSDSIWESPSSVRSFMLSFLSRLF